MKKTLRFSLLSMLLMLCGSMFAADDVTIVAENSLSGIADETPITVSGYTFTAFKNEGTTAPTYNANGKDVRLYAKNTLTIKASKAITKVVITCQNPQSGSVYNGNDMMYGEAGGKKVTTSKDSDTQVTFSGFSDNTLFICNDYTEAKAGTQLRIVTMVITYAE